MEIHIEISSSSSGLPTPEENELRYKVEDAIEDKGIGKVIDSGGGMGVMDIFVEVEDGEKAKDQIEVLIKEMGLGGKAKVST